jgi:8-oxo-dGTP diphosphatase
MGKEFIKPIKFKPKKTFIPDRRIINAFLVNNNGEVLLLKRSENNDFFPGYYHVLSGNLKKDEDFKDCFIRETLEETGIGLVNEDISEIGDSVFTKWDGYTWETKFFDALVYDKEIVLNGESSKYLWINPLYIKDIKITDQVKDLVKIYRAYWLFDKKSIRMVARYSKKHQ